MSGDSKSWSSDRRCVRGITLILVHDEQLLWDGESRDIAADEAEVHAAACGAQFLQLDLMDIYNHGAILLLYVGHALHVMHKHALLCGEHAPPHILDFLAEGPEFIALLAVLLELLHNAVIL